MPESTRSVHAEDRTLSQAISDYLGRTDVQEREAAAQELNRFQRWYGGHVSMRSIAPIDIDRYQEHLAQSGLDGSARLEHLKAFLTYARKQRLTDVNLGALVRLRRKSVGTRQRQDGPSASTVAMRRTGYEQMKAELERLEQEVRPRLAETLRLAAADRDFRENAPYDAAKQELAQVQTRINQLRAMLSAADIQEDPEGAGERIGLGSTVVLHDLELDEEVSYTLVGPGEIDPRRGRISIYSPVGKALTDKRAGEIVEVQTPAGSARYRIVRVS